MRATRAAAALLLLSLAPTPGAARAPQVLSHPQWHEAVVAAGIDPAAIADPLETTAEMRAAAAHYAVGGSHLQQLANLQGALFDPREFVFDYDADISLTAAEAFSSRRGNCVAFTNLFIALARSQGVPVRLAILEAEARSEREGDLVLVNTHVVAAYPHGGKLTVFDFYRQRREEVRGVRLLDDLWITGIYLNNRAVARLRTGDLDGARLALDLTVRLVPSFVGALGNLGVVRRRSGDLDGAFEAYRRALEVSPRDPGVLGNLAALYASLGREREAAAALRTANLRTATPWTLLVRGDLEAAGGRPAEALEFYRRAKRLAPDVPEIWLAIAQAEAARGRDVPAYRAATRVLLLDPDNDAALALLGTIEDRSAAPRKR